MASHSVEEQAFVQQEEPVAQKKVPGAIKNLVFGYKVFRKAICILDDIPWRWIFVGQDMLGAWFLIAAGFLVYSVEFFESIWELVKLAKLAPPKNLSEAKEREVDLIANLETMMLSLIGLTFTAAFLFFTVKLFILLAAVTSIGIPATMAVIEGIEFLTSLYSYLHAKPGEKEEAKTKLIFSSIFFAISVAVASFAAVAAISSLGVISLGFIPSAILISIVAVSISLKIFELVDQRNDYKYTKKIKNFFHELFSDKEKSVENNLQNQPVTKQAEVKSEATDLQNVVQHKPVPYKSAKPDKWFSWFKPEQNIDREHGKAYRQPHTFSKF
jgi:hypothetical protein